MKRKTIFISRLRREAEYWARAWGFERDEWYHVSREEHARGLDNREANLPVFVCGSGRISRDVVESLEVGGFTTFMDAHDLGEWGDHRSALDLLEV